MTRKPLPKVIRRSDADLHVVSAAPDVEAPAPQELRRNDRHRNMRRPEAMPVSNLKSCRRS